MRYIDYKGNSRQYIKTSDSDTPELRHKESILLAFKKCGLVDCVSYKSCDLVQVKKENIKCIKFHHINKLLC